MQPDPIRCPQCGAPLPAPDAPCNRCLLGVGLEAEQQRPVEPGFLDDFPEDAIPAKPTPDALASSVSTEQPGHQIGHYKLLQEIGEGGFGTVWMAEQKEPVRRRVALKIVKLGMDTRAVIARFEAERQALALMDHPNIAKVLDAGATATGRPYFVMELVRGTKITDYCDQNRLPTPERLALFIQVCQAVQHAHQKGIIHRDLKPSNILVTLHDGVPVPKVVDFGIAKATAGQELTDKTLFTAFEQFMGTPAYMSPEQAEMSGLDVDTRSDIYSLGVLLYELLTGHTPLDPRELAKAGRDEVRRIIRETDPPRPSTRISTLEAVEQTTVAKRRQAEPPKLIHLVRGDLDWIVMKCLEKDRTRRYNTATSLAEDLRRHLGNEPVVARPPSSFYRLQKLVKRNKLIFATLGSIVLALIAGLGLASWGFAKARAEARRAETNAAEAKKASAMADFLQACRFIAEDKHHNAIAYLVRCLRTDASHEAAAVRLATLLTYHSWWFSLNESLVITNADSSAQFSPDGRQVLTVMSGVGRPNEAAGDRADSVRWLGSSSSSVQFGWKAGAGHV